VGRIGEVLTFRRIEDERGNVAEVTVDIGDPNNPVTAEVYLPPGSDEHPLPGDEAFLIEGPGTGNWIAVGFADTKLAGTAEPGERIIFSRSAPGVIAAKIHLKADGSVVVNGTVTISPSGAVSADGEVTAMASGSGVTLSQHIHPTGVGPTSPATPGT
jgi:hypothetical protein